MDAGLVSESFERMTQTKGRIYMRNQLPVRSTQFSFPMSKCAIALLCCAFSIEPLFAQDA